MTKKEINTALEAATARLNELRERESEIAKQQSEEYMTRVRDYFKPLLDYHPEVTIEKECSGVSFRREGDGRFNKELVSLRYTDWSKDLELNTYTTIVSSEWELERLMFVGDLANVVKSQKDSIIEMFTFKGPLDEKRKELYKEGYAIEREITTYNQQLKEYERIEKLAKLQTEGIEFEKLTTLQVKFDWIIGNICKIKILKMTASGKSADLEITTREQRWGYNEKEEWVKLGEEERTRTVEKVRMDNLFYILN